MAVRRKSAQRPKKNSLRTARLGDIAHARSGDKGASANVGVIAYMPEGYDVLVREVTAPRVEAFFQTLKVRGVTRYEVPNLGALNFVLSGILDGGGSRSLRTDAQGKALGQGLLEMPIKVTSTELRRCARPKAKGE